MQKQFKRVLALKPQENETQKYCLLFVIKYDSLMPRIKQAFRFPQRYFRRFILNCCYYHYQCAISSKFGSNDDIK